MKLYILASLLAITIARPAELDEPENLELKMEEDSQRQEIIFEEHVPQIIKDEKTFNQNGSYSFAYETEDGIRREETGTTFPFDEKHSMVQIGSYSFTLPSGDIFELRFIADERGFRPESPFLPQPPVFPHPIPEHSLRQIEIGRLQREEAERRRMEEQERLEEEELEEDEVDEENKLEEIVEYEEAIEESNDQEQIQQEIV